MCDLPSRCLLRQGGLAQLGQDTGLAVWKLALEELDSKLHLSYANFHTNALRSMHEEGAICTQVVLFGRGAWPSWGRTRGWQFGSWRSTRAPRSHGTQLSSKLRLC